MTKVCQYSKCGKEFEAYHEEQKFCCRKCREKAQYELDKATGKIAERIARQRARRALKKRRQPRCGGSTVRLKEMGLTLKRRQEIEREMELPREQLMKKSRRWTAKERKYAQRVYENKNGLFRGRWD